MGMDIRKNSIKICAVRGGDYLATGISSSASSSSQTDTKGNYYGISFRTTFYKE